jgi:hypothetical protein
MQGTTEVRSGSGEPGDRGSPGGTPGQVPTDKEYHSTALSARSTPSAVSRLEWKERPVNSLCSVGKVTIPANHEIPNECDLVKVRYLYAYRGGSLFQPVYLGSHEGEGIAKAVIIATLKYKQDGVEDDFERDCLSTQSILAP